MRVMRGMGVEYGEKENKLIKQERSLVQNHRNRINTALHICGPLRKQNSSQPRGG